MSIALDLPAAELRQADGRYLVAGDLLDSAALTDRLAAITEQYHRAIERGIANASLIKLNQIGTVTETLQAMAICRQAGYRQFVSHRSGEAEDSFIANLAVGTGCGTSSPVRPLTASGPPSTTG